ncbi:hypothetical protein J2S09_001656 [Bacillus fengqiuensis]|nr:hypothetical protein [Bacillus fengqiuensis]
MVELSRGIAKAKLCLFLLNIQDDKELLLLKMNADKKGWVPK